MIRAAPKNTHNTPPFSRHANLSKSGGWFNEASLLIAFITVFNTEKIMTIWEKFVTFRIATVLTITGKKNNGNNNRDSNNKKIIVSIRMVTKMTANFRYYCRINWWNFNGITCYSTVAHANYHHTYTCIHSTAVSTHLPYRVCKYY